MNYCVLGNLSEIYKKTVDRVLFIGQHNSVILFFLMLYASLVMLFFGHSFAVVDEPLTLYTLQNGYETSFMSVILGRFLSFFYYIYQDFPWYGIFLYSVHIISLFLFVKCLLKAGNIKYWIPPILLLYLLFYSEFFVRVCFNNASIMLGTMSILAFLFNFKKAKGTTWGIIILGFLLSLCFLIRVGAIVAAFGCTLPLFVLAILRKKIKFQTVVVFLFPLILMMLVHVIVLRYDVPDSFKNYDQFNSLRHKFHFFPIAKLNKDNQKLFAANHWTKKDYRFLVDWFYINEKKYNVQTMENIFKYSVPGLPFTVFFKDFLKGLALLYKDYKMYFFAVLFLCIIVFSKVSFLAFLSMLFFSFFIISGAIYLWLFLRLPSSLAQPIFLSLIGLSIFFPYFLDMRKKSRVRLTLTLNTLGVILFLFVFILHGLQLRGFYRFLKERIQFTNTCFAKLNRDYPNKVLFLVPGLENFADYLDSLKTNVHNFKVAIIPLGWLTFSPGFYDVIKKELGAEYGYEILPKFIDNKRAYLVTSEDYLHNYLLSGLDIKNLRVELVNSLTEEVNIYRLVSRRGLVKF